MTYKDYNMNLADKARGLQKQAIFGAAISAIGQNIIGVPIARSARFKNSLKNSAIMGASGVKAPRTFKSVSGDAVTGVIAPEVNAAKNTAYKAGESLRKNVKLDKLSKRDLVVARLSAAGDEKGLARIGKSKSPLAATIRATKKAQGVPDISKADIKAGMKNAAKLPKGHRVPSSSKAALAANAAILPLPGGIPTAAVNVTKLGLSSEAAGKNKLMKKINKKLVTDPMVDSAKSGAKGGVYNKAKHWAGSILKNPFTEEANRMAYKAGSKSRKIKQ